MDTIKQIREFGKQNNINF